MRRDALLRIVVGVLCVGVLTGGLALVALWHRSAQAETRSEHLIRQQQVVIADLNRALVQAQRGESELRRLVQALQAQVRLCQRAPRKCGPPLTQPPTARTSTGTGGGATVDGEAAPTTPQASRSPRPSPSPTRSPRPSPSPSPSVCPVQRVCLPPPPTDDAA